MSQHHRPGAHELGQNFLRDHRIIQTIVRLAADGDGRLVEWAAGGGALTLPLAQLHRPLEAVEIDPKHLQRLRRTVPPHVCITKGDILRHAPPAEAWTLVSNVPFHITTPVLRRLLSLGRWDRAVLITQWEVARKRAGVGGTTQLTAQWWPWFTFTLVQRIPASAFSPRTDGQNHSSRSGVTTSSGSPGSSMAAGAASVRSSSGPAGCRRRQLVNGARNTPSARALCPGRSRRSNGQARTDSRFDP